MTLIDFIELSDDNIIDLSSDEETVQEDKIATQHRAMLLDKQGVFLLAGEGSRGVQAVFVAAGEGSQDVQAVFVVASEGSQDGQSMFVAASEGRQEASEPRHAFEATASSMIMEEAPLVAASQGSQDVQAVSVAASEERQETTESGHALEITVSSMVTEKALLVAASEGSQDVQAVFVAASEGKQEAAEVGHALEATTLSLVTETPHLYTVVLALPHAGSPNCLRSPTSAPFASLTTTTPKALTSQDGDTKLVRTKVKRPRKNCHTGTPKAATSEGGDAKLVTVKTKHPKKNHSESPLGTAVLTLQHAESPNCPRPPTSAPIPSLTSTSPKALSSEGGDANLVSGKVKHRRKNCRPCKLTP